MIFHAATGLDEAAFRQVQANVRKRILRAFVARGHLQACDAKDIAAYSHGGGFSVDAGMLIEAPDRAGLERLLRYCARPSFAMDRLKQRGTDLVYRCGKGHAEPLQSDKYSGELVLTPLKLIDRIAQLVPPPRTHRYRYYGVLAPNSPLRMAAPEVGGPVTEDAHTDAATTVAVAGPGMAAPSEPQVKPKSRPPSHYLWAAPIARIFEVFPLICPHCGGQMRIIAFIAFITFITFSADIHKILEHIGVDSEAPRIAPVRGPPLWDDCGAQETGAGVMLSGTGISPANQLPTTPTISALLGEPVETEKGVEGRAGVGLCQSAAQRVVCDDGAQILGNSDRHIRESTTLKTPFRCHTWPRAVGSPIRFHPSK